MNKIAIFVQDFQKATAISKKLVSLDLGVSFFESYCKEIDDYSIAVVDLNVPDFGNTRFIAELRLNSNKYLQIDKDLIPTGKIKRVKNSIYDFLKFQNLGKKLNFFKNKKIDLKHKGFDTTYIIKKNSRNFVGSIKNKNSNIQVNFFSNLPGVQLYSAQNLNYKKKLFPYHGICLETQYFPDTPNKKNFPSTLIKANKRYTCFTKIKIY